MGIDAPVVCIKMRRRPDYCITLGLGRVLRALLWTSALARTLLSQYIPF